MRRAIALLCLGGMGLCGCGGGGDTETPQKPTLTLNHDTPTDFAYGDAATLVGQLNGPRVDRVQLEASPYPFRGYRRVASARPRSDGRFEFRVRPKWNTRYRAVASGASSNVDTLIVSLRGHFLTAALGPHTIQVFLTGTGPHGLEARKGTKVFFYIRRRGSSRFRLIGARRPYVLRSDAIRAGGTFDVPPRQGDRFFICPRDGGMSVGLGFQKSPVPGCGHRTMAGSG